MEIITERTVPEDQTVATPVPPAETAQRHADAVEVLASLANAVRLAIFRQLVQAGPQGLAAGEIAARLAMPPSTLSFHLAHLARAGLVLAQPAGRQIIYAPVFERVRGLTDYLLADCCGGQPCGMDGAALPPASKPSACGC